MADDVNTKLLKSSIVGTATKTTTPRGRALTKDEIAAEKALGIKQVTQVISNTYLPKRAGGGGIKPSIPAKYNADTGKVVLLDLVQHSDECAELIKKGLIPLISGYVYIDEKAYNALIKKGLLDSEEGTFDINAKNLGGLITSAPNAKMGIAVENEAAAIQEKRKKTDFYENLRKRRSAFGREYSIVIPISGIDAASLTFEQIEGNLVYEELIKYVQNTTFKTPFTTSIHLYFTSSPALKMAPYPNSKLFTIPIKSTNKDENINITNFQLAPAPVQLEQYDSKQYEMLSIVSNTIYDTQGAGHLKAVKTSEVEELLKALEALDADEDYIRNLNALDPEIAITLKIVQTLIKKDLEELREVDKIFGSTATYFNDSLLVTFENLRAGANQLGQGIYFSVVTEKGVTTTKAPAFVDMLAEIDGVSTPESSLVNSAFKGAITGVIIDRIKAAWERAAQIYLERYLKAALTNEIDETGSHSLLQATLIKALGEIFGVDLYKNIDLPKNKRGLITLSNNYKKLKSIKIPKFKSRKFSFSSKKSSSRKNFTGGTSQPTQNIVALINADLKRYLLEEMTKGNALKNRTGTFANSVKVLSAKEEAAVQYTYEANPYRIFERAPIGRRDPRTGKQARPAPFYLDRRPSEIIDKAIKRIGTDRFGKVFRTQKV